MSHPSFVTPDVQHLLHDFRGVRSTTLKLCEELEPEDMVVQTMSDVSPTKWHLAHVTWFFETMVLARYASGYQLFDERYPAIFNSYYQALGDPYPREERGLLSRPTVGEILDYREHVDEAMAPLLESEPSQEVASLLTLGMHHEQQHQELLLMDILHVFAQSPLRPAYRSAPRSEEAISPIELPVLTWHGFEGEEVQVGSDSDGFVYDNERPRHRQLLHDFEIASHPVTASEFRNFMADGGYDRPELWLADGWDLARREGWDSPHYWLQEHDQWRTMGLHGVQDLNPHAPVTHLSYYEADAYATWAGARLPTEFEWEHAAANHHAIGNFLESGALQSLPSQPPANEDGPRQLFGDVWEWTSSPYGPYPGFQPFEGDLAEYNGKFMINQFVLRGGCCVTPHSHIRRTYRNFYYPHQRWMFSGFRLAR
jgi:ergothioneine biosynthesis protein EgtB